MREYLNVVVFRQNGSSFFNSLKLSEVHLINTLLKTNEKVIVNRVEATEVQYKAMFG